MRTLVVVKLGALGDIVMASTMIHAARSNWPESRIVWVCGESSTSLVKTLRGVDRIVEVADGDLFGGGFLRRVRTVVRAWFEIPRSGIDLLVIANPDPRYRLLTLFVRAREVRVLSRRWLNAGRWHGDEYARLIHGVNGPDAPPALIAQARFEDADVARDERLVILIAGGARNYARVSDVRRWPIENYVGLARELIAAGLKVAIAGGPTDQWVSEAFVGLEVIDWVGKTSIAEFLEHSRSASLVVTHDTGPMHMARLSGAPVLALFGPTSPLTFVQPEFRNSVIWGGATLPCRPCYDGCEFAACDNNLCMKQISVAEVFARVKSLLNLR